MDIILLFLMSQVFYRGLSPILYSFYPNIVPFSRPTFIQSVNDLNPHWLVGFVAGDGHLSLNILILGKLHIPSILLNTF